MMCLTFKGYLFLLNMIALPLLKTIRTLQDFALCLGLFFLGGRGQEGLSEQSVCSFLIFSTLSLIHQGPGSV